MTEAEEYRRAVKRLDELEAEYWPKRYKLRALTRGSDNSYFLTALNQLSDELMRQRAKVKVYRDKGYI